MQALTSFPKPRASNMTQWTGKLFVFRDDYGWERITIACPSNNGTTTVRAYAVTGPFIPIGMQKTITTRDADQWLADLLQQGFRYEPCTIES
jgi:hypothetical protein